MENLIWDHISWVMLHTQTILQHLYKMLMWTTSYWFSYRATINIIFSFTNKHSPYQRFVKYFVTLALFIFQSYVSTYFHIPCGFFFFFFFLTWISKNMCKIWHKTIIAFIIGSIINFHISIFIIFFFSCTKNIYEKIDETKIVLFEGPIIILSSTTSFTILTL